MQSLELPPDPFRETASRKRFRQRESAAVLAGLWWFSEGRWIMSTDNAYVKGDRVYIATEISGPIVEVAVRENQSVSRGQLLFRLDDQPYRTALAKIDAEIEIQRAEIRGLRGDAMLM